MFVTINKVCISVYYRHILLIRVQHPFLSFETETMGNVNRVEVVFYIAVIHGKCLINLNIVIIQNIKLP